MRNNTVRLLIIMLLMAASAGAHNTIIRGSFKKPGIKNTMATDITIGVADNGSLKAELQNILKPENYAFQFGVDEKTGLFGKIAFIGSQGELYPIYVGEDEDICINVDRGKGALTGKLGKENKFLKRWIDIVTPLRQLVYTADGRRQPLQTFYQTITDVTGQVDALLKNPNTDNTGFDKSVAKVLRYMTMLDVLNMFAQGISFDKAGDYPAYIQTLFTSPVFTDTEILQYAPQAYETIELYGFAKHIIYEGRCGETADLVLSDITDPRLLNAYILFALSHDRVSDLRAFDERHGSKVLPEFRSEYDRYMKRYQVNVPGSPWADFSYPDASGAMRSLSDCKGKVVVVDVWATWCMPCRAEMPALATLEKEMEDKDVVFIGLSIDTDREAWQKFVADKQLGGIQLFTNDSGPVKDTYCVNSIPRFMVFSKDGTTVSTDAPRPSTPELKAMIEKALGEETRSAK